ncbi:hypothetical protein ACWC0C_29565 [Streptomyces sp. NPDC001709]
MTTFEPRTETTIRVEGGETITITRADVAAAALDQGDYTTHGRNHYWVMVDVAGRLIPVLPLMRAILGGREPSNTNDCEMRFRELGFRIFVARLYDPSGRPVTLTNEQTTGARP